ncbi:YceI family protein [Jiulongibacter sp. NS-SX5]|uniref:YceI family protein n=1 Tax=Jiulongibacter sp. NS-SX5 TaxID=3463854 RepID=UPI00405A47DF
MSNWKVDALHSDVQFKVKHLMISTVTGDFKDFDASLDVEGDDLEKANVEFTAQINSISTGNEDRDNHLKSNDFFNAEEFPQLAFKSKELKKSGSDNEYKLSGDLTIRDITKPVVLDVEYGGQMTDFYGNEKMGFDLTGKINRKEFGLTWNGVTEAGGVVVSDEVKLILNIQMTKSVK